MIGIDGWILSATISPDLHKETRIGGCGEFMQEVAESRGGLVRQTTRQQGIGIDRHEISVIANCNRSSGK